MTVRLRNIIRFRFKMFVSTYCVILENMVFITLCFLGGSVVKSSPANAGDVSSIRGLGRCLGGGNDNLLQYFA